jgi:hypothetical protein
MADLIRHLIYSTFFFINDIPHLHGLRNIFQPSGNIIFSLYKHISIAVLSCKMDRYISR